MQVIRTALYVRVSTAEQVKEGYSIGEQLDRLTKYCEAMKWEVYKSYTDPGYSGANTNRPGLQDMLTDIRNGKIDKVVVYKLDRLSRSQKDTLNLIEDNFLAYNCDFVSISENFDTSTPFGRAMVGILAVFAQLEREQIKERMSMGKEARAKEGKWHGGLNPIGYDYIDGQLAINDYAAMQIREIYDRFLNGEPLRAIETDFIKRKIKHNNNSYWSPKQMRRVMSNELYLGYIKNNGKLIQGTHEPIIDRDTFDRANKLLNQRNEKYKDASYAQSTLLGGLLWCGHCGARYGKAQSGTKKYGYTEVYKCYSRHKKSKPMIKDPNCKNKTWKTPELDAIILDQIKELSLDPNRLHEVKSVDKRPVIEAEIDKIDSQINKLIDLYTLDKVPLTTLDNKLTELNTQKEALKEELSDMTASLLPESEVTELLNDFSEVIKRCNLSELRIIVSALIDHIMIDGEDITIYWNF